MKNIVLLSLLFFLSCNRQETDIFVLPDETPITSMDYPNEIIMNYPLSIDVIDNRLLLFMHKGEHIIKIVEANNGMEIKNIGVFGNGPGEFIQPIYWGINKDKEIYLYDEEQMKLRKYDWEKIQNTSDLPETEGIPLSTEAKILSGMILNNSYFVGSVVVGMSKPIAVLNMNLNVIENMGAVPDEEHQSTAPISYGGSVSTYDNKFVFVMASLGYIACYEQQKDGKSKILWDFYAELPIYKGDQLDMKQLKLGFSDVKMTKNYIFCSYFGQKYVRENRKNIKVLNILVFDHSGNLLKNFRTDRSVGKIAVSEDENTLYAVTETPEIAIIRYNICNLIK